MPPVTKPPPNPLKFKRGTTFAIVLAVPSAIEDGYFREWEVEAQIRRKGDTTNKGLIGSLSARWDDPTTTRQLIIFNNLTDNWPLGPAELDIKFTNASGYRLRTTTLQLEILRGITQ